MNKALLTAYLNNPHFTNDEKAEYLTAQQKSKKRNYIASLIAIIMCSAVLVFLQWEAILFLEKTQKILIKDIQETPAPACYKYVVNVDSVFSAGMDAAIDSIAKAKK